MITGLTVERTETGVHLVISTLERGAIADLKMDLAFTLQLIKMLINVVAGVTPKDEDRR